MRHGAGSARLTGPRAAELAEVFLGSAGCPDGARGDPLLMAAVRAWAQAEAECERLRCYRDVLEERLGGDGVAEWLTEVTETVESQSATAPASFDRRATARQRESCARALHRSESRCRSLRRDLWGRLGAQPPAAIDLAAYWAERARRRDGEAAGVEAGG